MPIDAALLATIRAKAEGERTPAEAALLAAADEQSEGGGTGDIDWDKAFQHPRFKQLVADKNKAESELKTLKDKQAEETGNFRTLYETTKSELEIERGKSSRADTLETALKKALEAELAALTPEAKKLVPEKLSVEDRLDWIATNRALLTRQKSQDIGAGGGRSMQTQKPGKTELSPEEKQVAALFGYSSEEYAKYRDMGSVDPFATNNRQQQQASAEPEAESEEKP